MRTTATRAAAALAFGLVLQTVALAAPVKLTDSQLDLVSAGVSATVSAAADALGATAVARTNVRTGSHEGRFISIAWGGGAAFAKGTDAAQTAVDASGEGGTVRASSYTAAYTTPQGTVSRSWGFVFVFDIDRAAIAALR